MVANPSPVRTAGATPDPDTEAETESGTETETESDTGIEPETDADADADANATPADGYACPLCGFTHELRETVYTHLRFGHRKRAISSALLERRSNETAEE